MCSGKFIHCMRAKLKMPASHTVFVSYYIEIFFIPSRYKFAIYVLGELLCNSFFHSVVFISLLHAVIQPDKNLYGDRFVCIDMNGFNAKFNYQFIRSMHASDVCHDLFYI